MRKIKNILLLAGGDSSRFWPLENKLFFEFLGKPFILFQIEELLKYCQLVTVVVNKSNATTIKRLIDNTNLKSVQILIQKENYLGMAGAIYSAKGHIRGETLIVNGSDLIDYSVLITKLGVLVNQDNKMILVGKKFNEYFPGGYFKFDDSNHVIEMVEKPGKDKRPSSITKLVFDYFADINIILDIFPKIKTKKDDLYELSINEILSDGIKQTYFLYDSFWFALKYPWHILALMHNFLTNIKKSQISESAVISEKALLVGPIIIEDNVKIGDFSKIVGPAYIGKSTIVGDYSLIRESQIGEDCLVGSFTEVARSYIGNNVYLHRNYVGDSILDNGVLLGAQTVTANLKFNGSKIFSYVSEEKIDTDMHKFGTIIGQFSKVGVNATILPGVKIGKKTWVGPREVIRYDLDDKTYLAKGKEQVNLKV